MLEIKIDEPTAELLLQLGITPFTGPQSGRFSVGAVVKARPGSRIEAYTRHSPGTLINLGSFSYASANGPLITNLSVGRYCSIAVGVRLMDGNHPLHAVTTSPYHYGAFFNAANIPEEFCYRGQRQSFPQTYGPTSVGNDVWIGSHCTIRSGLTIGDGAVIAGGANVVSDVPPYAIVGGNPAKIIRYRFPEELRLRLLDLQWWDVSPKVLRDLNMYEPERFCTELERRRDSGELTRFAPKSVRISKSGEIALTHQD